MSTIGSEAPSKSSRSRCWAARDAYFECLDKHGLWLHGLKVDSYHDIVHIDPGNPPIKSANDKTLTNQEKKELFVCLKAREFFEKECLPSWVCLFKEGLDDLNE
jgi:cytochrome c oxidase assembly factor 6